MLFWSTVQVMFCISQQQIHVHVVRLRAKSRKFQMDSSDIHISMSTIKLVRLFICPAGGSTTQIGIELSYIHLLYTVFRLSWATCINVRQFSNVIVDLSVKYLRQKPRSGTPMY